MQQKEATLGSVLYSSFIYKVMVFHQELTDLVSPPLKEEVKKEDNLRTPELVKKTSTVGISKRICAICTFENAADAQKCETCESTSFGEIKVCAGCSSPNKLDA